LQELSAYETTSKNAHCIKLQLDLGLSQAAKSH